MTQQKKDGHGIKDAEITCCSRWLNELGNELGDESN